MKTHSMHFNKKNRKLDGHFFQIGKDSRALNLAMTVLFLFIFFLHSWVVSDAFSQTPPDTCTFTLDPPSASFTFSGGYGAVIVNGPSTCDWAATSHVSWIVITSGITGFGGTSCTYYVLDNLESQSSRLGTLTIAGHTFTINQEGNCHCGILSSSKDFPSKGGSGSIRVTAVSGCSWTASSYTDWITITSGSNGSGNGSVKYSVSTNTSTTSRTGAIHVQDKIFYVDQSGAPACTYSISPTSASIDSSGGRNRVRVTAGRNCTWTAISDAEWITITSGSSGSGNGNVNYLVSANTSTNPRTGTMTIAEQTYTITQSGIPVPPTISCLPPSCSFTATQGGANPERRTLQIGSAGGGTLNWTIRDNARWLTVTPTKGSNGEAVDVDVQVNIGGLSAGTYNANITITAQAATNSPVTIPVTLTVNPPPPSTIDFQPNSFNFTATQGVANPLSGTLEIWNSGGGTLNWRISDNTKWLSLSPTTGASTGVEYPYKTFLSVNIGRLPAGTYNATITITAKGATNSPVTIPVTLVVNAPQTSQTAMSGSNLNLDYDPSLFQQTSDGGYIAAGETESSGPDGTDIWISKLDQNQNIQWQKIYGGFGDDWISSVQETSDGGYMVVGETDAFGLGQLCIWVLKLDSSGNIQWQRAYDGFGHYRAYPIR